MVWHEQYLAQMYWGNTGQEYVKALLIFILLILVLWIFKKIIILQLHQLSKKTKTDLDDYAVKILQGLGWPFYLQIAFNFSVRALQLAPILKSILDYALLIVQSKEILR